MHSTIPSQYTQLRRARIGLQILTISALCLVLAGCRSGRRFDSMVQVTEDPSALIADVEPPEQRLATSTTASEAASAKAGRSAVRTDLVSGGAGMPQVFREKPAGTPAASQTQMSLSDAAATEAPGTKTTVATIAEQIQLADKASVPPTASVSKAFSDQEKVVRSPQAKTTPNQADVATVKSETPINVDVAGSDQAVVTGELVSASLTDLSDTSVGLESTVTPAAPSDPTALAAGQLAGDAGETPAADALVPSGKQRPSVRRPINQTNQPHSLNLALEQSLDQLPNLPAVRPRSGGPAPTRIAAVSGKTRADQMLLAGDQEPSIAMNADQIRPVSHASDRPAAPATIAEPQLAMQPRSTNRSSAEMTKAELYGQLLNRMTESVPSETPADRERRLIAARHLMVLAGEPQSAIESIEGFSETEQQYLKNQLMGLWTMIDPDGHPSSGRRITEALPQFREATRLMAAATDSLALKSLEFCTQIESYGQIKPFAGNRFAAGQQIILYCEVENFAAIETQGQFQTQLRGNYDIYDAQGTKLVSQLLPVDQQRSRNRLRDYFVAYQMNLPKGLTSGTYRLQLTIEDVVGKKYGQSEIPFEIR
jgi:hypothetical protein